MMLSGDARRLSSPLDTSRLSLESPQSSNKSEQRTYSRTAYRWRPKAKIHYTSFPGSKSVKVGDFLVASPQQVHNINDKSVTSWRGQKSAVSVVSCRFPTFPVTTTFANLLRTWWNDNKSATSPQLPRLRRSYEESRNVCNGFKIAYTAFFNKSNKSIQLTSVNYS